ncbi:MAG TPA: hypothetical protein VKF15_07645, partial [Nitrososphaerales archaeon]|nr:hypothetical protein [Nitrososphaerales archaeon]
NEAGVDPGTVSHWLHRLGVRVRQGQHRVPQPPLRISDWLIELTLRGPTKFREFVEERVFEVGISDLGGEQLVKFCKFVQYHKEGKGVGEIARLIRVHRTTVAEWRNGTDMPYLAKVANSIEKAPLAGWKWLPIHLTSGGSDQSDWIEVPERIRAYDEVLKVVRAMRPSQQSMSRGSVFGLTDGQIEELRPELFAYSLGMLVGDAGKHGGKQSRFASMSVDLQLTEKEPSNERLGEFFALCINSLGLKISRVADKQPTGDSRLAEEPSPAFRWISERSPFFAWMFRVCMGLEWSERTSTAKVRMNWISDSPARFRTRFVQGLADSDGTARNYSVEIASMPNAEFVTSLLRGLGMTTAYTRIEDGEPTRTAVLNREAAQLPIFNELVAGYRYQKLMKRTQTQKIP